MSGVMYMPLMISSFRNGRKSTASPGVLTGGSGKSRWNAVTAASSRPCS